MEGFWFAMLECDMKVFKENMCPGQSQMFSNLHGQSKLICFPFEADLLGAMFSPTAPRG